MKRIVVGVIGTSGTLYTKQMIESRTKTDGGT